MKTLLHNSIPLSLILILFLISLNLTAQNNFSIKHKKINGDIEYRLTAEIQAPKGFEVEDLIPIKAGGIGKAAKFNGLIIKVKQKNSGGAKSLCGGLTPISDILRIDNEVIQGANKTWNFRGRVVSVFIWNEHNPGILSQKKICKIAKWFLRKNKYENSSSCNTPPRLNKAKFTNFSTPGQSSLFSPDESGNGGIIFID